MIMRTKEERKRCKKSHETTIGKIIYGFLLFLPLLAIGVTCGYAMFNKNAYQSYTGEQKIENIQYLNTATPDTLPTGNSVTYYFTKNVNSHDNSNTGWFNYENISIPNINPNGYRFRIRFAQRDIQIQTGVNSYSYAQFQDFTFNLVSFDNNDTGLTYATNMYFITYSSTKELDNVFYYSVNKITQSELFNWSQNSIIYTGMSNFTTALSITNTFVPTLLTYWLIISIVYFMYDIVLMMLTILHRKIHDLQDSI